MQTMITLYDNNHKARFYENAQQVLDDIEALLGRDYSEYIKSICDENEDKDSILEAEINSYQASNEELISQLNSIWDNAQHALAEMYNKRTNKEEVIKYLNAIIRDSDNY